MKTLFYNFSHGIDAMTDRRMLPDGFVVVADNVDLRSGYPKPVQAPSLYAGGIPTNTTRIWEFQGQWFYSALYRTYAAEALATQQRIYWAEEGNGHTKPQKMVNRVQAPLGTFVPLAAPFISNGSSISPTSLTVTPTTGGILSTNAQYSYRVAANTDNGTLPACAGVVASTGATNNAMRLTWGAVAGATSYTIFGRTQGKEQVIKSNWGSTSFLDDGTASTSGAFASSFDVNAALQYVYTYVRKTGPMPDESGPSPIAIEINAGFGRLISRNPAIDGFFTGAATYTASLTTAGNQFYRQIIGILPTSSGCTLTLASAPQGAWLSGLLLRLISGANPSLGGSDVTPSGVGTSWAFPTALVTPAAPTTGTPVAGGTLGAGTYNWVVTAIQGQKGTGLVSGFVPAQTLASAQSAAVVLGSANIVPVAWTPVLNATGYRLYRTANGGSTWALIAETNATVTTYQDNGSVITGSISLPATNTTATQCIVLPFDASGIFPNLSSSLSIGWAAMEAILVSLPTPQVVANGDAILFGGGVPATLNKSFGATLPKVVAIATANVSIAGPASATFDGYAVQIAQTVLLTAQSSASQNGPWVFNGVGVAMTRPIWYASGEVFTTTNPLPSIYITNGTVYGKTYQDATTAYPFTVDTTATAWVATTTTASFLINAYIGASGTMTSMTWTTGNNGIISWRIYRTGDTTSFLEVAEVPISQFSFEDFVPTTALSSTLPTSYSDNGIVVTFKPPPVSLRYIELFNGMLFGVDGNTVRWTPIGVPDAWPDAFTVSMSYPPTGLAAFASGLIILCPDAIYRLDGFDPTQLSLQRTYAEDGCIAPRSIQKTSQGLLYVAKRGVMLFNGSSAVCLTEGKLPPKFLLQPSAYSAGFSQQNFYWFTTDYTQAYASLNYENKAPIYSANVVSPTILNDLPQDGIVQAIRSFVYRNRYFLFYSGADGADYAANTMVCIDLGAQGYPISTLGAKLLDAHVSALDEAYTLMGNSPPSMSLSILAPMNGSLALSSVPTTYTGLAVTGASGGPYDGPYTYSWTFDDLGTGSGASVTHTWTTSGVHAGTVSVVNSTTNQTASASVSVEVISQWILEGPMIPAFNGIAYGPHVHSLGSTTALIIGSDLSNSIGNSCYIYDNLAHTVTATGSIPASRTAQSGYNSCLMGNGNILISGGFTGVAGTKHAYIYSKSSGLWAQVADRNVAVSTGTTYGDVVLPSGKIFSSVADSTNGGSDEIYDPVANTWATLAARGGGSFNTPSVALMSNGKVFRGPGVSDTSTACFAYDTVGNTWASLTACPYDSARIIALTGGKLLGIEADPSGNSRCSIYDPIANTWTAVATLPVAATGGFALIQMADGTAFLAGSSTGSLASYRYDPVANTWTTYPTYAKNRAGTAGININGTIALIGALNNTAPDGRTTIEYLA